MRILAPTSDLSGVPVRNFVHRIDPDRHPTWGPGWRWCVSLGDDPSLEAAMLQAGLSESEAAACRDGDQVAAAIVNAFRLVGVPVSWAGPSVLDHDPIKET